MSTKAPAPRLHRVGTTDKSKAPNWAAAGAADDPLLSREEAAEYLNVSWRTIKRLLDEGDIPFHKVRALVRVRRSALDAYLAKERHRGKPPANTKPKPKSKLKRRAA